METSRWIEFTDARRLVDVVFAGDVCAHWAPGDGTSYRVGLVRLHAYGRGALDGADDLRALLVVLGVVDLRRHLLVPDARGEGSAGWSARSFAVEFGLEYLGWWPGLRPVLAALNWVEPSSAEVAEVRYRPTDVDELTALVNELYPSTATRRERGDAR